MIGNIAKVSKARQSIERLMLRPHRVLSLLPLALCLFLGWSTIAWGQVQVFDGLIIYNRLNGLRTFLIDTLAQQVHTWTSTDRCAFISYLMPDSTIWRTDVYSGAVMRGAAYGGLIQQYDWDGNIIRSFVWSDSNHQQHHDIHPMPNGNILLISWERKTQGEAEAMGRVNINGDMWSEEIIEYDPVRDSVVWEWHVWDHLIQDVDSTKINYGVVSEHPELIDINLGTVWMGDWLHFNTIDYNPERDEIILTSHYLNEIYVIDHSTTTEEARGHTGGRHGKGGDIIYRWGNPQNYDRGDSTDKIFYGAHGANWIRPGMWGAGDIIVLNNGDRPGTANDYSEVFQITPPLDSNDHYYIHPDSAFGPQNLSWYYSNPDSSYTQLLGGVFRLPNGNTFVTLGMAGRFVEINSSGQVVWSYNAGGQVPRAIKYSSAFLVGKGESEVGLQPSVAILRLGCMPNPWTKATTLRYHLPHRGRVWLAIYDVAGKMVKVLIDGEQDAGFYDVTFQPESNNDIPAGVYFARLTLTTKSGVSAGTNLRVTRIQ